MVGILMCMDSSSHNPSRDLGNRNLNKKNWMQNSKQDVYLGAYLNSALKGLDDTPQPKSKAGARWIVVKCNRQKGSTECGYYTIGIREIEGASHPVGKILNSFKRGLNNSELLPWPEEGGDPCGSPPWKYIFCNGNRVAQIQTKNLGLVGPLPPNLNELTMLENLGLQNNNLNGPLPSFKGLTNLKYIFLGHNDFDSIPVDFFEGLKSLEVLALDYNEKLNASNGGWNFPATLEDSAQLRNLSCMSCNLVGPIPGFFGDMASLSVLLLSGNNLTGEIPATLNAVPALQVLWLNNQRGEGLGGKIDVLASMVSLTSLLLRGNSFEGSVPMNIGDLVSLKDLDLNGNEFVGLIPSGLGGMILDKLDLNNNHFMGPIPEFAASKVSYENNEFCEAKAGVMCAFEVMVLLEFLGGLGYPWILVDSWSGNDPCHGPWLGIRCNGDGKVDMIILEKFNLNGTLSPSVAKLDSLVEIRLGGNDISGTIPSNWTSLKSLTLLDLSGNNISRPLPSFGKGKKKGVSEGPGSLVIHPRDASDPDNVLKIVVANNSSRSVSTVTGSGSGTMTRSGESRVIEAGNLVISVQVLRNVTKNFARENEVGRGGFGVVYKGELEDGTKIAVKRMESGVITSKALDEFQSEIAVLSKVRHRHLLSLLGYSVEGKERILVYEYMPQGALSMHLFHWKSLQLEPLSWKRRLNIALDVARGMEYLHSLAHQIFIHRDLKSSNILLGDDFRAKVSDFGLVKLAPDGKKSVVTRLAGTFGYLAPEYAVTGKVTTKADVFSFGVVLMELLTGLMALDEDRPEETQYLASWFWHIKSDKEKLMAAIDPALDIKEEMFDVVSIVAELAGHCTTREPNRRPDMSHAVNVLSPLVQKWKPLDDDTEEYAGVDYSLPLNQMVKEWQETEGKDLSYVDLQDSKSSIPERPTGLAESFTSIDGR
ncbi:Receptor-like kinase TMK2 [Glycine soja]